MPFYLLIGLVVVLAGFVAVIARQPAAFRFTRTASMRATPAAIFAQINNLHAWEGWSPWAKLDPNAKNDFTGPAEGAGASMGWSGSAKVGVGRMTIVESVPDRLVKLRLDFEKPMKATNIAEFTLKPEGENTVVTWSMTGSNSFVGKAVGLILNCEKMVGGQFDQGLAGIKSIVEKR